MRWHKNPEIMATIGALGSFFLALVAGSAWRPLWYVFEPGWLVFRAVDWFMVSQGLALSLAQSDAETDILFYLYGPLAIFCLFISAGIWAGIGYWAAKIFAGKGSET